MCILTSSEGLKGLNHSLANIKKEERHLIELGDPQWSDYDWLSSSHDGRYVSFNHKYAAATKLGEQPKDNIKWLKQGNEPEDEKT